MGNFTTLEILKTFAGATVMVTTTTQMIKEIIKVFCRRKRKVDNRIYLGIALFLSFSAVYVSVILIDGITVVGLILAFFNSLAVWGASTASFRAIKSKNPKL